PDGCSSHESHPPPRTSGAGEELDSRKTDFFPTRTTFPTCPPSRCARTTGQGIYPSFGGLTAGTHRPAVPLRRTDAGPTVLVRESHRRKKSAQDESRSKNNVRTRIRKKPEHSPEVRPPVRLRARPDYRTAANCLAGTAHGHPPGDRGRAVAWSDEFTAFARWRAF